MTKYHDGEFGDKNFEFSKLCNQYEKEERHVTYLENYAIEKPDVVFGEQKNSEALGQDEIYALKTHFAGYLYPFQLDHNLMLDLDNFEIAQKFY